MSLDQYKRVQQVSETPRQAEYRLFAQITGDMVAARDAGDTGGALAAVLHRNREMWTVFASDCGTKGNALPDTLRASIISLSLWVNKHTSKVILGVERIDDLISINRNIMAGLAPPTSKAA